MIFSQHRHLEYKSRELVSSQQGQGSNRQIYGLQPACSPDQELKLSWTQSFHLSLTTNPSPSSNTVSNNDLKQVYFLHLYPFQASINYCLNSCYCFLIGFLTSTFNCPHKVARFIFSKHKLVTGFLIESVSMVRISFWQNPKFLIAYKALLQPLLLSLGFSLLPAASIQLLQPKVLSCCYSVRDSVTPFLTSFHSSLVSQEM